MPPTLACTKRSSDTATRPAFSKTCAAITAPSVVPTVAMATVSAALCSNVPNPAKSGGQARTAQAGPAAGGASRP